MASPSEFAGLADTNVQSTFKRVYTKAVDAVPDATALSAQFARTRKFRAGPDGLHFNAKLETGGPVANVPDGFRLPRAGKPRRAAGKVGLAHTYTVIMVGGQSIPLTSDRRNAFVSNLEDQMQDAMIRVRNDLERQNNGDGRGILCSFAAVAGAPTYTVEKPYGVTGAGPGTMLLIEDMDVAVINPATGLERGRSTITAINTAAGTITLAGAVAGAAIGDFLVLCNDVSVAGTVNATTNYLKEAAGIQAVAKSGDVFENIDGAVHRRWNAVVMANQAGAKLTEKLLSRLEETVKAKSGKRATLLYTTRGIRLDLASELATLRRIEGTANPIKGGYDGVEINGRTVLVGDWAPKGMLFAVDTEADTVGTVDLVPMGFIDLDGAELHRVEGHHAYRADLWIPHEIIWFRRNSVGLLPGLADDSTITRN